MLVPPFGAIGAAVGFLGSELFLMLIAARACVSARFAVPVGLPLAAAAALTLPMAVVVALSGAGLAISVALGVLTYAATLGAAWRVKPELLRFLHSGARGIS
jgi:hypothetical protein